MLYSANSYQKWIDCLNDYSKIICQAKKVYVSLATIKDYDTIELVLEPAWKSRYWAKTQICKNTSNETNIVKIVLKNLPYPSIAGKFEDQQSTGQELHLTTELSILFVKYQTSVLHAPSTLGKQQKSTCGSGCRNSLLYHLAEVGLMISKKNAVKINILATAWWRLIFSFQFSITLFHYVRPHCNLFLTIFLLLIKSSIDLFRGTSNMVRDLWTQLRMAPSKCNTSSEDLFKVDNIISTHFYCKTVVEYLNL